MKKISQKTPLSYRQLAIFVVIFAAIGGYILWKSFAATPPAPTVYLTPDAQTFGGSTSFSIQVRENSGTTPVNAVQANLSYSTSLLTLVSVSTSSTFGVVAQNSGANGVINIGLGVSGGSAPVTGDQLVATLNFKTNTTAGTASVPFTTGTALVSSSTNTNLLSSLAATGGGTYTIDLTPPTVSLTSPANGATISAPGTVTVSATASDAASSVSKVEIYIDGGLKSTLTSAPYNYSWSTSGVNLGAHTIQAKAYDAFNNVAASSTNTVTLADQTAPAASITAPAAGAKVAGTVSVNANASDNTGGTGVSKVEFYVDGTLNATDTAAPYSFAWNSATASNAAHSLTVKAYDNASPANSASSAAVSVTVDNSPPSAPGSLRTTGNTTSSISLAWNASTDNTGVTGYKLSRNGNVIANLSGTTLSYTDSNLAAGTSYSYSLVATDAAGNSSPAATLSASTVSAKQGDLNGDNSVDVTDLSILLSNYNTSNAVADINHDGTVDVFDLSILLSHYGT